MNATTAQSTAGSSVTAEAASLEFRDATKRYPGAEKAAVEALSLEVPAGEICVLVGPSGCGKTTAMRMVNRMIEISDGDILVGGESVRSKAPAQLRREIGYVIQQIGLFPHKTIGDNIATVPELLGWNKKRIRARVEELLELIGLTGDYRDRYPAQLSGGQRQRVGVARALAADPPLMLMDEPFGAIDPINRERLQNEFLRLQAELRKTIVFVTHDIDEAIKMGDKIAILKEGGHLAQFAPPAELLMYPAEPFVEDFVGADRALKRLALQRVRDIDLWRAATVRSGEPVAEARKKLEEADLDIALLVDDQGRPKGWLSERGLQGERVREELRSPAEPVVELDDILRDALSDLLQSDTQYGPVVDADGAVAGVLSMEVLAHALSQKAEHIPTASELAAHELAAEEAAS
jgi:osmoprotectant transport system ATP-binding protein